MRVTALVENTSRRTEVGAEHGLSLYIEWQGQRILFDMGYSDLFARNAEVLGIDLSQVDWAVLSHGHHDHGGGLGRFLELNDHAPVYVNEFAFQPHFNGNGEALRYNGLNPFLAQHPRLVFTGDERQICDGAALYSSRGREKRWNLGSFGLLVREDGQFLPDDFRHEQYLLLEEDGRRVLFSGCSHNGVLDIVRWFQPDVLVGGFHLMRQALDAELLRYGRALDESGTRFFTCHCTGLEQYRFLRPVMGRVEYLSAGMGIEI